MGFNSGFKGLTVILLGNIYEGPQYYMKVQNQSGAVQEECNLRFSCLNGTATT